MAGAVPLGPPHPPCREAAHRPDEPGPGKQRILPSHTGLKGGPDEPEPSKHRIFPSHTGLKGGPRFWRKVVDILAQQPIKLHPVLCALET